MGWWCIEECKQTDKIVRFGDGDDVAEKLDRRIAAECVCMVEGVLKAITSPE